MSGTILIADYEALDVVLLCHATLGPGELVPRGGDELKDVRMGDVKVKNDGAVFIDTTSPELFVKGTVDFPKRDRTTSNKALAIISSGTSEFRQIYRNSRSIAESVRDKSPGCFDSIRTLHTIFYNKYSAAHRQPTAGIIDPVLNTTCACNEFSGHNAPV